MDKTREMRSNGKGICEKIRRSLAASSGKHSLNGESYVQQEYVMPASAASTLLNTFEPKHKFKAGVVPIEFDRSAFAKGKQANGQLIRVSQGNEDQTDGKTDNTETESKMNDKFSEYIHHAKMKIGRTSSNVGARGIARLDTVNKKATAYIDRARQRIKNSATFRGG